MSEDFKNIVQEKCNIEAHAIFSITETIQCQTSYCYETLRHTYCARGAVNPLTTSAFVF